MLPPQNYLTWKVCISVLHAVAIGLALLRIRIRWKDAKLWWDDHVAAAAMLVDVAYLVTLWRIYGNKASFSGHLDPLDFTKHRWLSITLGLYFVIFWFSRISLSLSIARLFPVEMLARKSLVAMAVFFFIVCLFTCLLNAAICILSPLTLPPEQILLPEYQNCQPGSLKYSLTGGITASVDFLSDILSIVVPLVFLWRITLPPKERRLIHGTLLATVVAAFSSVVTTVFWYAPLDLGEDYRIIVAGVLHIQAAVSLIICNLLVVVTYFWRKTYRRNRPTPRRYRHNDPNIPTTKTSPQRSSTSSSSQSQDGGNGMRLSTNHRTTFHLDGSSRLPDDLTFTPISPLSEASASNAMWSSFAQPALKSQSGKGGVAMSSDPPPSPPPPRISFHGIPERP